ncbi:MAG: hypothetical protein AAFX87_28665 [Bacteroidota bacterium]
MELLENISQITNPNLDLNSITVLGIRFGDAKDSIPSELITEGPYRGWFHTKNGVTIRVSEKEPSVVTEFLIKPDVLTGLKLTKKSRIEKRFGKAEAIEQQRGFTYYFYESQHIVVGWSNSDNRLFGIYIGENVIKQTQFRIRDFLNKYYEFKGMVPNYSDWNLKSLRYNEPRFYRLKELQSLMLAFNIGNDLLQDFKNLNFIKKRSIQDFRPIIDDLDEYANSKELEKERWLTESERLADVNQFGMLIQTFLRFSEEVRSLLRFNNGWLETGSVTARYSIHKTQKLIDHIDLTQLDEIESLLCKLLDPEERVFTKSELVGKYNFPDVDLHAIDMDNY